MIQKPKLLIFGGGHADIPLIKAGSKIGYHVITSGNRPEDLGHKYSDEVQLADFSDAEAMLAIAMKLKVDAVCSCCNDYSAISAAYVAEKMGLPGHDSLEVTEIIHHKDKYRDFSQKIGIPSPRALGCSNYEDIEHAIKQLSFPIIIKPVDLTGGKGITSVDNYEDAVSAAKRALSISKVKRIVIEEFITGTRHGFSAMLRDGQIVFHFTDDEYYHLSPYLVSAASAPTSCPPEAIKQIIKFSEKIASKLRLGDGIFHVQFIQPEVGNPIIIEICRRAPGDLYVDLVRHSTGAPYAEWIVRASCGLGIPNAQFMSVDRCVTRHCLMANHPGTFSGFNFNTDIEPSIIDKLIWAENGDEVVNAETHKFGIVFVEHQNKDQLKLQAPILQELLSARIV